MKNNSLADWPRHARDDLRAALRTPIGLRTVAMSRALYLFQNGGKWVDVETVWSPERQHKNTKKKEEQE
jgi:hypothetical protein